MKKGKWLFYLYPISIILLILAKVWPRFAEYVLARGLFRILSGIIGGITRFLPCSLGELLVCLLPVVFLIWMGRLLFLILRKRNLLKRFFLRMAAFFAVVFFFFTVLCAGLYGRYSFVKSCDFQVEQYSKEQLYEACVYLAGKCNETKEKIETVDENGALVCDDFHKVAEDAGKAYQTLGKEYPVLFSVTGKAKPVFLSKYMSYTGIVGIYFPFTAEANVNTDVPDYNRPADTCHELAHLHGFMREEEANFIAYLACTKSSEAYFQYSGYMSGLIYASNALYDEDANLYTSLREMLSEGVKADLRAESEYWNSLEETTYETVEAVSDKVNDTYLKLNGQESGVKSYGEMVDLLLAYLLSENKI